MNKQQNGPLFAAIVFFATFAYRGFQKGDISKIIAGVIIVEIVYFLGKFFQNKFKSK